MTNTIILRTRALKLFRAKLGNPVRNLNSVVIGLCGVGAGIALKPEDLAVSWNPKDLLAAEREARGFAIKSLMVTACDALDHYLEDLGVGPSPVMNASLRSTLKKEPQIVQKGQALTTAGILALEKQLNEAIDNPSEIKSALRFFSEKFCGKQKAPSLNARWGHLLIHTQASSGPGAAAIYLRPSYQSAVALLIAWRNVLVHDMDKDPLDPNSASDLIADKNYFAEEHAGIDIEKTLERYWSKSAPSLKDISTLVSILLRHLSAIDARLIATCDLGRFVQEAVCDELKLRGSPEETLRKWAGKSYPERTSKALKIIAKHGFVSLTSERKKNSYPGRIISREDIEFLNANNFKDLSKSVFSNQTI